MRSIEHNVEALDNPHYMSWWIEKWSYNASRLINVLRQHSRVLFMTAALSPAEKPEKLSWAGELFAAAKAKNSTKANPDDFGDRIAHINNSSLTIQSSPQLSE